MSELIKMTHHSFIETKDIKIVILLMKGKESIWLEPVLSWYNIVVNSFSVS